MPAVIEDCLQFEVDDFPGPALLLDERPNKSALLARNVEYLPGQVATRAGFPRAFTSASGAVAITTLYNWIQSGLNRLIYLWGGTDVNSRDLTTGVEDTILVGVPGTTKAMSNAQGGPRLFMAFYDNMGNGTTQGRVWDGLFTSGNAEVDKLFQRPLKPATEMTIGVVEGGIGNISQGLHNVAVIFTTRNGYTQQPSPSSGPGLTGVAPATITAVGGSQLTVTITPVGNWPAWLRAGMINVQVIMTPVVNPSRYFFVPGATASVAGGFNAPVSIVVDIDDVTLQADTGLDVLGAGYFDLLEMAFDDSGPFFPSVVLEFNNRLVYITQIFDSDLVQKVTIAYISDQYNYQSISADQSSISLPGFRQMVTGFPLGNVIYWLGPHWTYASADNTGKPVTWAPPQLVDGRIGTFSPRGVDVNVSKRIAWVADKSGLYPFTGYYPLRPTSYYQTPDWNRINWAVAPAGMVQVKDHPPKTRVVVMVPLDGATTPTHLMTFDYTNGITPEEIKYSLDPIGGGYLPGAIEVTQNNSTKQTELWVSPTAATGIVLRQAAGVFNDNGAGIDSRYQCRPSPDPSPSPLRVIGAHFRAKGSGNLNVTSFPFDQNYSKVLGAIALAAAPGLEPFRFIDQQADSVSLLFDNGAVPDAYFILSRIRLYYNQWAAMR